MPNTGFTLGNRAMPAKLAAAVAILFGLLSLTGWALHVEALSSIVPGSVTMKANTALTLVLCGIALAILADRASARSELIARCLAALALLIGMATISEYAFDWQLGIDEWLFKETPRLNSYPGRMAPFSAVAFVGFGLALVGLHSRFLYATAKPAAAVGAAIGVVSLIGYLWHANELITDRWLPPVAINTAFCFVLMGAGILTSPDRQMRLVEPLAETLAAVEMKILAGFLVAIALLLFGGSITYHNSVQFADSVQWFARTQEVRTGVADLYGSVAGAEVAERDFLLTQAGQSLVEYHRLVERIHRDLEQLGRQIADNPEQHRNFLATQAAVQARLQTLASALTAFNSYGLPAARALLALSRHSDTVESVDVATAAMDAVEVRLLEVHKAATVQARLTTLVSLLVTLATASAMFYGFFRAIHREMLGRRAAEQALRDRNHYNRSVIESSPDCVAILTTHARITQMTPQGLKLLEIDDFATVAGTDWCMFWSGEHRDQARAAVAAARDGNPSRFEGCSATHSGIPKWWDIIVKPVHTGAGHPERLIAVARDITEVKRAATNLLTANRFLDSLIENLPAMIVVKDAATLNFVRVNKFVEELIGHSRAELVGKSTHDFFSADEANVFEAQDRETLDRGVLVDVARESVPTGMGVRIFHTMKMPLNDHDGKPQFVLAISIDITERELAEQAIRELNTALQGKAAQLESTNKELESFSYSVSHDLRAPLRAIDGFTQIIEEDYADKFDDEGRRHLSIIRQNSKRMGTLIDDLLEFSRLGRQPVANTQVNIETLVREVIQDVLIIERTHTPSSTRLPNIEVGPLPPALGDLRLLRQVWTNLISNAIKYSSKVQQPVISVSGWQMKTENHYSVRDNGVGFNMDYAEKIFGVFQRLHRNDEFSGTGVGLAIVHRVVSRHGGRVWAEGKVDDGAVFTFALPRQQQYG